MHQEGWEKIYCSVRDGYIYIEQSTGIYYVFDVRLKAWYCWNADAKVWRYAFMRNAAERAIPLFNQAERC